MEKRSQALDSADAGAGGRPGMGHTAGRPRCSRAPPNLHRPRESHRPGEPGNTFRSRTYGMQGAAPGPSPTSAVPGRWQLALSPRGRARAPSAPTRTETPRGALPAPKTRSFLRVRSEAPGAPPFWADAAPTAGRGVGDLSGLGSAPPPRPALQPRTAGADQSQNLRDPPPASRVRHRAGAGRPETPRKRRGGKTRACALSPTPA